MAGRWPSRRGAGQQVRQWLVVVQAAGCAPIPKAWAAGKDVSEKWENATTYASGLRVPGTSGWTCDVRTLTCTGTLPSGVTFNTATGVLGGGLALLGLRVEAALAILLLRGAGAGIDQAGDGEGQRHYDSLHIDSSSCLRWLQGECRDGRVTHA